MISRLSTAMRYGRGWRRPPADLVIREVGLDPPGEAPPRLPATLVHLPGREVRAPAWILLHGVTRPGRAHPTLQRFARAVAAAGGLVLVPEIPGWRDLRLVPEAVLPTVQAAAAHLRARHAPPPGGIGLIGFSFGAPLGILASRDPVLARELAVVVGYGGYCDLERTLHFQFTGEHEWEGRRFRMRPDPYGRWIVGANFLTRVPGMEEAGDVARALHALAVEAGERRLDAWDPAYDPVKAHLREGVAPVRRPLFDLFAPPAHREPDPAETAPLARGLAEIMRESTPLAEPRDLAAVRVPVRLIHGRQDRLIPFSETLRLAQAFPPGADVRAHLTGLFAHSQEGRIASGLHAVVENLRLLGTIGAILGMAAGR